MDRFIKSGLGSVRIDIFAGFAAPGQTRIVSEVERTLDWEILAFF